MNHKPTTLLIAGVIFLLFFSALGGAQESQESQEDGEQPSGGELLELELVPGENPEIPVDINITDPIQDPDIQIQDPDIPIINNGNGDEEKKEQEESDPVLQRLAGERLREELPKSNRRTRELLTGTGVKTGENVGVPVVKGALKIGKAPQMLRPGSGRDIDLEGGKEAVEAILEGSLDTLIGRNPLRGGQDPAQVQISDVQVAVVASAGLFFLLGAVVSGSGSSKGIAYMAPMVPLYSRIHKEEVFKHQRRQYLYQLVVSNPGISFKHLKELTELQNGALRHHLTTLERENYIKSIKDGKRRRFYLNGKKVSNLSQTQQQILYHIKENPNISQAEIAALMNVSRQNINYHLKKMEKQHILRVKQGDEGQYFEVFERRW